jgi:hypothetical protein
MALDPVQVAFVNESVRPTIEKLIQFRYALDAFVLDFDNQQNPLPTDATVLDDNATGTAPRTDAPQIAGSEATQLRNFAANMRDQISSVALDSLVELAVRPVAVIIRD